MTNKLLKDLGHEKLIGFPPELSELIKSSKKNRFRFQKATETIEDIDLLYHLDEDSHANISSISSKYLASSFSIEYLKAINKFIKIKYKIPQLTLQDFTEPEKLEMIKDELVQLGNKPIINWLKKECLEELNDAIDNLDVDNIDKLMELGHIISLSKKELLNRDSDEDIEIYDILYRYLKRLNNFDLNRPNQNPFGKIIMNETRVTINKTRITVNDMWSKEINSTTINVDIVSGKFTKNLKKNYMCLEDYR